MAWIHSETFDIINGTNIEEGKGAESEYFEVDDLIALPIALLNKKGYRTRNCCSGHPFENINEIYSENETDWSVIAGVFWHGSKNGMYCATFRMDINECYISFDDDYFSNCLLPENFVWDEDDNSMRNEYYTKNNGYERVDEILRTMKRLFQWVEGLPNVV